MRTTLDIQRRLAELGYDPGPADGIRGRQTIAAVKRFQAASHLAVDGIAGPATLKAMFGGATVAPTESPDACPWLDQAWRMKGLHERRDNAALREFLKRDGGTVGDPAKVPWCGDFVQTCIALTLPDEVLPNNPYAAINWMTFGRECAPQRGAVLVFWRGSPEGWQGHIGYYVGEDATHYHVLGGNQSDSITVSRIAKTRLRKGGCRWPLTALAVNGGTVIADGSALTETTNEA
ncbi:peptidoglycan-binding protein [Rhizobium cremeum]|uniref:NlpC/P60 family protein n=1 Tax=Rhizobium cremeum TaxID=2813827 RepID=UPI0039E0D7FE